MAVLRGKPFLTTWTRSTNELKIYELDSSNVFVQSGAAISLPSTYVPLDGFRTWNFYFSDFSNVFSIHGAPLQTGGAYPYRLINRAGQILATATNLFQRAITGTRAQLFSLITKDIFAWYPDANTYMYAKAITETAIVDRNQLSLNNNAPYSDAAIAALSPDDSKIFIFNPDITVIQASRFSSYTPQGQLLMTGVATTSSRANPFRNVSFPGGVTYNEVKWAGKDYCIMVGQQNAQDVGLIAIVYNFRDPSQTTELTGRAEDVYSFVETLGQAKTLACHPNSKLVAIGFKTLAGVYRTGIYRRMGKYLQRLSIIENFGAELSFTQDGRFLIDAVSKKAYNYIGNYKFEENTTMMANVTPATYQGLSLHSDTSAVSYQYNTLMPLANQDLSFTNLKALLLTNAATFDASDITVDEVTNNGAYVVTDPAIPVDGVALSSSLTELSGKVRVTVNNFEITLQNPVTVAKVLIYDGLTDTPLNLIDFTREVLIDKGTPFKLDFENGLQYYVAQ